MEFKNKEIELQYIEKVEHIKQLNSAPVDNSKFLWDMTVDNYAKKIAQVDRVLSLSFYTSADWEELWKSATSTTNSVFIKDYKKLNADVEKNKWLSHAEEFKTFPDLEKLKS